VLASPFPIGHRNWRKTVRLALLPYRSGCNTPLPLRRILSQLLNWAMKARYNCLPMFFFHSKAPFILVNAEIAAVIKKASELTSLALITQSLQVE
jgi:hypothetical protein